MIDRHDTRIMFYSGERTTGYSQQVAEPTARENRIDHGKAWIQQCADISVRVFRELRRRRDVGYKRAAAALIAAPRPLLFIPRIRCP